MLYSYLQYRDFATCPDALRLRAERGAAPPPAGDSSPAETASSSPTVHPASPAATATATADKDSKPSSEDSPHLVTWSPGEPGNPQNWSHLRKWLLTLGVTAIGLVVGAASSIDSAASREASSYFGVSSEVMELQTALYLLGFGLSAPLLGPLSEVGGRVPVYVLTLAAFTLFEVGAALAGADHVQTRMICRFFAGFFGSAPLSNSGGSIADVVGPRERTYYFAFFAQAAFSGPVLGPVMGGYLAMNVGQEWCDWLMAIWGGATTLALFFLMPETYAPVLLRMKAQQLRRAGADARLRSQLEVDRAQTSFGRHLAAALKRPLLLLLYEPIVLLVSLYMTAVYIILFSDFEAYAIIYGETFGFNNGEVGLAFLPVIIGLACTLLAVPWLYKRWCRLEDRAAAAARAGDGPEAQEKAAAAPPPKPQPEPEERLVLVMALGWLVPAAMFYQAWVTFPHLPPWPALSAGILFGCGILATFISSYQYIIDVYGTGSASALAALTLVRYCASAGAAMFAQPMYRSLNPRWAQTLLAFISLAFTPVPWVFYVYGKRIRRWSRFAKASD